MQLLSRCLFHIAVRPHTAPEYKDETMTVFQIPIYSEYENHISEGEGGGGEGGRYRSWVRKTWVKIEMLEYWLCVLSFVF